MTVRFQSVLITASSVQITYEEERDVHTDSGIATIHTVDIPHEVVGTEMFEDLQDSLEQILDHARTVVRSPVDAFRAAR